MLQGASGTEKDVIANVIHANSSRKAAPFITINCGSIPANLIESELFGHEQGAFTGADKQRIGKFELADQGTLFLDEISELSLDNQTKLLRVLQNKEIQRVGGDRTIPINVRIIAAANKDLESMVEKETFRLDLFYRLNVFPIHIPKLNERGEDIILLAKHFIEKYADTMRLSKCTLANDAIHYLQNHQWKGNVRELENIIQRAMIIANGKPLTKHILAFTPGQSIATPLLMEPSADPIIFIPKSLNEHEEDIIKNTLTHTNYNMKKTAEILNVSRTTLYNKCKKYGISISD